MGFTNEQKGMLQAKLDSNAVKSRSQSGRTLSYVEGWHAIAEANRIFGEDGWSRETVYLKEVCRYEQTSSYGGKTLTKVGYEAKVRVTLPFCEEFGTPISRDGTGYGQGTMGDLFDAMESAGKEAETDAMKRALMTFGNPFGLALYDKTQANVEHIQQRPTRPVEPPKAAPYVAPVSDPDYQAGKAWVDKALTELGDLQLTDVTRWANENEPKLRKVKGKYPDLWAELAAMGVQVT